MICTLSDKTRAPQIIIIGAGGHATMLLDALSAAAESRPIAVLDADVSRHGTMLLRAPIIGGDDSLSALIDAGATHFAVGVGTSVSGDNGPRRSIFARLLASGLAPLTIVHPRAIVSSGATIGAGAQILPGAIVNTGARIGINAIVNSGAIIEHDCSVGDHAHVASGACIAGGVIVENNVHIGARAVVRQLLRIGDGAVIGIGAAVIRDVAPATVVAGVPAKPLST